MKKVILLITIFTMFSGFISPKREAYKQLKKAEQLYLEKNYTEAEKISKSVLDTGKYTKEATQALEKINYAMGNYDKVVEIENADSPERLFNIGNSYKNIGDKTSELDKKIENYEKALLNYKNAMKNSQDKNIRKNYEIVKKVLDQLKQQQDKQKNDQQDKDKQEDQKKEKKEKSNKGENNKDNSEKDSKDQEKNNDLNNQNKKDQNSSSNSDSKQSEKDQKSENKEKQDKMNKENEKKNGEKSQENKKASKQETGKSGANEEEKEIDQSKLEEILYHLKKLEMNEKEDLKNNQRVVQGQVDEKSKDW